MPRRKKLNREEVIEEIASLELRRDQLQKEVAESQATLDANRRDIDDAIAKGKAELDQREAAVIDAKNTHNQITTEINELNERKAKLIGEGGVLVEKLQSFRKDITAKEDELARINATIETSTDRVMELDQKALDSIRDRDAVKQEIIELELDRDQILANAKVVEDNADRTIREAELMLADARVKREEAKATLAAAESMEAIVTRSAKELDKKNDELGALSVELALWESKLEDRQKAIAQTEGKLAKELKNTEDLRKSIDSDRVNLKVQEAKVKELIRVNKLKDQGIL
jgi:hypothetical protein